MNKTTVIKTTSKKVNIMVIYIYMCVCVCIPTPSTYVKKCPLRQSDKISLDYWKNSVYKKNAVSVFSMFSQPQPPIVQSMVTKPVFLISNNFV